MADALDGEHLVCAIKQILVNFRPDLRKFGSVEMAEDSLRRMEELDGNFHRYDLVKSLRSKIHSCLGDLIVEEVEKLSLNPHDNMEIDESMVAKITDKVLGSPEYTELMKVLKRNVTQACNYLDTNFDSEFPVTNRSHQQTPNLCQQSSEILFSDGESSFGESSLNQSTFMFMNPAQMQHVGESIQKKNSEKARLEALSVLIQTPSFDAQNCEPWPAIRQGLLDALADSEEKIWTQALRFMARNFSANNPGTREMYTALGEFLSMQFNVSNKCNIPKVKNGLDCRRPDIIRLCKSFRLMNEFQLLVPQYWIRFPDRFLEEVLDTTLSLLAIHYSTPVGAPAHMTPVHFLALVDTKAHWFKKWMHGNYSRAPLLKMLTKYRKIIENAVRVCLELSASRKVPFDLLSDVSEALSKDSGEGRRNTYTGAELEYIYFVHSLYFLSRLLYFERGRELFPVKLKDRDGPVDLVQLVVSLVQMLTEPNSSTPHRSPAMYFDMGLMITDVLKKLCVSENACQKLICKDNVTDALLAPISYWLDKSDSGNSQVSEHTLLQIADILSVIASNSHGRQHILYGEKREKFSRSKSSPAHILTEFSRKALSEKLPNSSVSPPSKAVIGNFSYICRQLYATCEGLLVMNNYDLHSSIAAAWRQASRDADQAATPTPSIEGDSAPNTARESQYIVLWEDTLRDNLLNYAGTPKGVLLLQEAGALKDCVSYMFSRYVRKLQVSKCEKFGYGYMMSQVAATAPGVVALQQTEFFKFLLKNIWGSLEIIHDFPVYAPKTWPVNPIDKVARKSFNNLVNVLSSFPAVYELLGRQSLPTKTEYSFREIPDTIPSLLDRIVMIDSDAKIHALFNYEQSHIFGLRLLSALTSCLDTQLLLQLQYNFLDLLLKQQEENVLEGGTDIVIDMLSVERNYLLVKSHLIGGPNERNLPPRSLAQDKRNPYPSKMFFNYPVPKEYIPQISVKSAVKQENDLTKYLAGSKKSDSNPSWLDKCKKHFCSVLTSRTEQPRGIVLQDILERSVDILAGIPEEAVFPLIEFGGNQSLVKNFKLSSLQKEGIKLVTRYGLHIKVLSSAKEANEKLTVLMKQCGYFLQQQQRKPGKSSLRCLKDNCIGMDWFAATIFLMMNGDGEKAWKFLYKFSSLAASGYMWSYRLHSSVHLPQNRVAGGIPPLFSSTCHNVELILQAEVPHVHSAFKMSGFAPAQICQQWIRQCFWNYLDWTEICNYVSVCVLLGVDYQVYLCVAILKFLQRNILEHMQDHILITFLKEEPIRGFRVGENLEYMQQLEKKYRKTILGDMWNLSKP